MGRDVSSREFMACLLRVVARLCFRLSVACNSGLLTEYLSCGQLLETPGIIGKVQSLL